MVALRHVIIFLPLWDLFPWNILGWKGSLGIIESISTVIACYGQSNTNSYVRKMWIVPDHTRKDFIEFLWLVGSVVIQTIKVRSLNINIINGVREIPTMSSLDQLLESP